MIWPWQRTPYGDVDLELKIEQYQEHTNEYREDNDNQIELLRHEVSGLRCTSLRCSVRSVTTGRALLTSFSLGD